VELTAAAQFVRGFYRLVGEMSSDPELVALGESVDEIAYIYLTQGTRAGQRWMLDCGYMGWRKRSSALTWTGTDDTTGGTYSDLPSDFLRAFGSQQKSALVEADGRPWGTEVHTLDDTLEGDGYYFRGDELWLLRRASPPSTLYLSYHFLHPAWDATTEVDFPVEARGLIPAEAANLASLENFLPGGNEMLAKIDRALKVARERARGLGRPSKQARMMRKPARYNSRY